MERWHNLDSHSGTTTLSQEFIKKEAQSVTCTIFCRDTLNVHSMVFKLILVFGFGCPGVLEFVGFAGQVSRLANEVDGHETDQSHSTNMQP